MWFQYALLTYWGNQLCLIMEIVFLIWAINIVKLLIVLMRERVFSLCPLRVANKLLVLTLKVCLCSFVFCFLTGFSGAWFITMIIIIIIIMNIHGGLLWIVFYVSTPSALSTLLVLQHLTWGFTRVMCVCVCVCVCDNIKFQSDVKDLSRKQ